MEKSYVYINRKPQKTRVSDDDELSRRHPSKRKCPRDAPLIALKYGRQRFLRSIGKRLFPALVVLPGTMNSPDYR